MGPEDDGPRGVKRKRKRREVNVLAWNTRTLRAEIAVRSRKGLEVQGCHGKLVYIRQIMVERDVDFMCISEHHCADKPFDEAHGDGLLWKDLDEGYKFVYCQRVGMVMSPTGYKQFQLAGEKVRVYGGEGRVMAVQACIRGANFTFVSVYGPTYQRSDDCKTRFWDSLAAACDNINQTSTAIVLGDFNARAGTSMRAGESDVVGRFGGERNANGELLLNFCGMNGWRVANSFFR